MLNWQKRLDLQCVTPACCSTWGFYDTFIIWEKQQQKYVAWRARSLHQRRLFYTSHHDLTAAVSKSLRMPLGYLKRHTHTCMHTCRACYKSRLHTEEENAAGSVVKRTWDLRCFTAHVHLFIVTAGETQQRRCYWVTASMKMERHRLSEWMLWPHKINIQKQNICDWKFVARSKRARVSI